MKKRFLWKRVYCSFGALHLADKCLLIFMAILMAQSAHNLFFYELVMEDAGSFDVIVRTTAAAIFGYFISANFQNGGRSSLDGGHTEINRTVPTITEPSSTGRAMAKIGFLADTGGGELQSGYAGNSDSQQPEPNNCLQILVVAVTGIIALVLLVIAHNYFEESNRAAATISQLRDFVSSSVGFLIGHSTTTTKSH